MHEIGCLGSSMVICFAFNAGYVLKKKSSLTPCEMEFISYSILRLKDSICVLMSMFHISSNSYVAYCCDVSDSRVSNTMDDA